MISISETFVITVPPAEVWALFRDPALVAACIPGATLVAADDDGSFRGTMMVKFGPTTVTFRGDAKVDYDDVTRTCTIEGRGVDQKGASRAIASGTVAVSGNETTEVSVRGRYNLTGPLEMFARAGGVHLARALMADFAANIASLAGEARADAARDLADAGLVPSASQDGSTESAATMPQVPRAAGGLRLLWRAFLGWLKTSFRTPSA